MEEVCVRSECIDGWLTQLENLVIICFESAKFGTFSAGKMIIIWCEKLNDESRVGNQIYAYYHTLKFKSFPVDINQNTITTNDYAHHIL